MSGPEGFADSLLAEADSQNAFAGGIFPNQGKQQSNFGGNTGSGREHNFVKIGDLFQRDLVVAGNGDLIDTCFAQQLYDVVCKGVEIKKRDLSRQDKIIEDKIKNVPQYERELSDIMRQQRIKDNLYVFLLEKREENG